MSKPEIFLLLMGAVCAMVLGPSLLHWLPSALARPAVGTCTGCGAQIHPSYGRCDACIARQDAIETGWARIGYDQRAREQAADAERREAERIATRAKVLAIGSVTVDAFGAVTFDGWQFGSLPGLGEGEIVPVQGRISPSALIAGWRQSELHALAHGALCDCLSRAGARVG